MFDESGDGTLDEDELEKLLRKFGQEPTKEKATCLPAKNTKLEKLSKNDEGGRFRTGWYTTLDQYSFSGCIPIESLRTIF